MTAIARTTIHTRMKQIMIAKNGCDETKAEEAVPGAVREKTGLANMIYVQIFSQKSQILPFLKMKEIFHLRIEESSFVGFCRCKIILTESPTAV